MTIKEEKTMNSGKDLRIALISPQIIGARNQIRKAQPPLGLAYIAAVLEERGYKNILILDAVLEDYDNVVTLDGDNTFIRFGMSDENIIKRVNEFSPDIIGISSLFSSQTECAFSLVRKAKSAFPDVPIVMGGTHASFMYEDIMKNESIDFIIVGEGDYVFADFVENYFNGENYRHIPGIVWREGERVFANNRPPFINNIDKLPFPAWHLFDMEKYFKIAMPHNPFVKSGRVGCIITSRGCPQSCYFCSSSDHFGHAFRAMSSKRVIEMIHYLVDRFAIEELQILDDTFTINYKRVIDICEGIKHLKLRISLPNAIRADVPKDHVNRLKMFQAMRDAGVEQIGVSVEHGDQEFLNKVIEKRLDLQEVIATCDLAHKVGILVHANFMMGFPFEDAVNRQRTIEFAKKLDADSFSISLAAPLPGTRMWNIVEENGLFMKSFSVNRLVYVYVNIIPHDITPEELYKLVDNLNRELNEAAQRRRPETMEKYKLFKGKTADGDRKYHFVEE